MGYFLAVTAFRSDSVADVSAAISDYLTGHGVSVETISSGPPDSGRDAQIYAPTNGWTVVLWPAYFNLHDFPLARSVAAARNWLVSTVHVYDDEYWEHLAHNGPTELHAFCSRPNFWRDESPDDFERVARYDSTPERLATVVGAPVATIQPYLTDADTLSSFDAKAYPDDEFPLGDFWVFTDFWRRLGIPYPTPPQNLATVLRLAKNFTRKLPNA